MTTYMYNIIYFPFPHLSLLLSGAKNRHSLREVCPGLHMVCGHYPQAHQTGW